MQLLGVAIFAGVISISGYKLLDDKQTDNNVALLEENSTFIPTTYASTNSVNSGVDFTEAAEKTVHAVVHVKNKTITSQPTNIFDYMNGKGQPRATLGTGSGVIISPDGYIVTNNHVIENASELTVTLNNNITYEAELIGTDPKTDIALIRIKDSDIDFPFVPFADSNTVKIGEWVLAVGNPFNLTSTVTAGIVSAKARDLAGDSDTQSFIQTDAAVNRGNSGGALVNTNGELIGINTAITSETGSYVGYSFAVPSNNARKVVEDIMEFGDVQRGILGISALNNTAAIASGANIAPGVHVADVEKGSGADKGGIKTGDIIQNVDGIKIAKFSDLVGYLGSKRPNDVVEVQVLRDGNKKNIPVTLIKLETLEIPDIGLEVKNVSESALKARGIEYGVEISRALTQATKRYRIEGDIITLIDDIPIKNIDDAKRVMSTRRYEDALKITFINKKGETHSYIFR
ncbi:serine protease [unidentified eubacterium SCB49]|nr:serine protease [unidentified eubacterium SCB49]